MFFYNLSELSKLFINRPRPSWEGPPKRTGLYTKKYVSKKWREKAHLAHKKRAKKHTKK